MCSHKTQTADLDPKHSPNPAISLLVPVFNEADNIDFFYARSVKVLEQLSDDWEIIFINDGSNDRSAEIIQALRDVESRVKLIDFSRNFGKEVALSAGIDHASGDVVVPIDADLQHPPEVISELLSKWREGYDVVFASRSDRKEDALLRRIAARFFYRTLGMMTRLQNQGKIGDFCLLDRVVVDTLRCFPEHNRFMKGLFSWIGFNQTFVQFQVHNRLAGQSKWSFWKLWNFGIEGITSFTNTPLRVWTYCGLFISSLSILYAVFIIIRTIVFGIDVPGYASLIVSILFIGGIQLVSLGIFGEYIGRIYIEVKARPLYIMKRRLGFDTQKPKRPMATVANAVIADARSDVGSTNAV